MITIIAQNKTTALAIARAPPMTTKVTVTSTAASTTSLG